MQNFKELSTKESMAVNGGCLCIFACFAMVLSPIISGIFGDIFRSRKERRARKNKAE